MLKINSNFIVEVEGTKFYFKKPSYKDIASLQDKKSEQDTIAHIFSFLHKVENLQSEDGKDLSADDVKTMDLPFDVIMLILKEWKKELNILVGGTDPNVSKQPIS